MQNIIDKTIILTKGDTFKATVGMVGDDGTPYTPQEGDVVRFHMKRTYKDTDLLIEKIIPNDTLLLQLDSSDTSDLDVGKYVYDIQITYANGDVDTFIDCGTLKLTEEVEGVSPVPPEPPDPPSFVRGTFTTGQNVGTVETVEINYEGSGYPVAFSVWVDGGLGNWNVNSRYSVGQYSMVKSKTDSEPTFVSSLVITQNMGNVTLLYKSSAERPDEYSVLSGSTSTAVRTFDLENSVPTVGIDCIKFIGDVKTMKYYIANPINSTIGLAPNKTYAYFIAYSE